VIAFDWIELIIAFAVGLHVPKAFGLLYGLIASVSWRSFRDARAAGSFSLGPWLSWWPSLAAVFCFSIAYVSGMLHWGIWAWQSDRADIVNALFLPVLCLWAGLHAVRFDRAWLVRILLAYSLGSLIFVLIALAVSRSPWWNVGQLFPSNNLFVPWGHPRLINVRSIEQNAVPALALLPASLFELIQARHARRRLLLVLSLLAAVLGGYALWSLQGRLGWLILVLVSMPSLAAALQLRGVWNAGVKKIACTIFAALFILLIVLRPWRVSLGSVGWSQGFCDERLSLHAAILRHGYTSPWGGRLLVAPYQLCDGSSAVLAPSGGTVTLAHNVVLDIFLDVGLLPVLLLLAGIFPLFMGLVRSFWLAFVRGQWGWLTGVCWAWFVLLFCEWMFQPLLYSDGLLYYFSYFVMTALVGVLLRPGEPFSRKHL